ncbi:AraC family transcriptional regulator [Flavobacterium sp. HSC-61S13]|uniref:helix-turn-helix domain-containing protein n=1 Tax=Flavobacterium sp. HSC-61S13 TaxID=2910963 RepID=UPI00209F1D16|nr:helix-turn-helix domain-containing protein [Flavobacterium sp. HSC-61S13]MCP1994529.1 AraC-like DNA-binding protein/tellurite resistance-related uncharacterized protein [Flavobacterium sp. HSC-61S13]
MIKSISLLSMNELIEQFTTIVKTKDYFIFDTNHNNLSLKLEYYYKADYFGVIMVMEGCCDYNIGVEETAYHLSKGDILFCVPSEIFRVNAISDDYKAKQIFFSVDYISVAGYNYKSNDILKSLSNNPSNVIHQKESLFRRLLFHIQELQELNKPESSHYYFSEMIWHHFSLMIYEINNYFKETNLTPNTSREEELTTTFFSLVRTHFKDHHDVQFYADQLFVTRKYLSRVIKKTMSQTPRDIINQVLLIEAKLLLKNTAISINEVTVILNFSDQAVFSKFFKKHAGKTPSAYKKNDLF